MAILDILTFPDERLRTVAKLVTVFDASLACVVSDMFDTMYHAKGIGLAATQVNIHRQIIVIDIADPDNDQRHVLINPVLLSSGGQQFYDEGCLSVPGITADSVMRAAIIKVRANTLSGDFFEIEATGLLAVCIQHEMDHLQGKVFVDYLSRLRQSRIKSKLLKQKRLSS